MAAEVGRMKTAKNRSNELGVREYSVGKNALFCLKSTLNCYPPLLAWCGMASLAGVLLPILATFLPKAVIEEITGGGTMRGLILVTLIFTLPIALLSGCKRFADKQISHHKYKMNTHYTHMVARKGMTTDYRNQESQRFRQLMSESFSSCNGHFSPMTQIYDVGIALISNALGFVVYFGILVQLNVLVILFLIATTLVSTFLNRRIVRWAAENNREKIGYGQRTHYINGIAGDLRSAKDIRLYDMAGWFQGVYEENLKGLSGWYGRYAAKVYGVSAADSGLSLLREGVAYAYLLFLVLDRRIGVADFVLYFGVITGFSLWLGGILEQINALHRINLSFNYLRAYLEYPETYKREGGVKTDARRAFPGTIELKNVRYRYEGAATDALRGISLTIRPGEHIAVVGLNGAGKTTLVKLICGLVDPTEGVVLYDGIDAREYDRRDYYKLFSAVFQQFSILPVTIREIVSEAVDDIDEEKVALCLRHAGLWEKVAALPKGTKSEFGKAIHDDGVEFSGGETQKLLLARALYKVAPVMILDEPTAALDPIAESRLYETYDEIMREQSTVFISHRLASTRFCSRILLIEGGEVIEEGTHEKLLLQKGRYFELFETQAKYYREYPEGEAVALCVKD